MTQMKVMIITLANTGEFMGVTADYEKDLREWCEEYAATRCHEDLEHTISVKITPEAPKCPVDGFQVEVSFARGRPEQAGALNTRREFFSVFTREVKDYSAPW